MDAKYLLIGVVAVVISDIAMRFFRNRKRNDLFEQLSGCLAREDYVAFDALIDSRDVIMSFPPYNLAFLKLNEAMMKDNKREIDRTFDSFTMPMNRDQKETLYKRAFYYYLGVGETEKAAAYYELIKDLKVVDQDTIDAMYDTYVLKGSKHLEDVLTKIEKLLDEQFLKDYDHIQNLTFCLDFDEAGQNAVYGKNEEKE